MTQVAGPSAPSEEVTQAAVPGGGDATVAAEGSGRSVPGRGPAAELPRGAVVGRYVVLGKLGAGGMGVVYAAYDPELDRKVALKVLRADAAGGSGSGSAAGGTRLLREAQALAKLSHPNVVTIHDVGEHEGQVWLAMEFVEGETLGAWLTKRRRSWKEVLSAMLPVARGLAAAHAKGLVHRDVKPDNVMIGADGRVRVMDFGLAQAEARPAVAPSGAGPRVEALGVELTQAGSLLGTPAYMSPEQFSGGAFGPASDQFSYCVMLWVALYGERPYAGETAASLAFNVLQGKRRAPPSGRKVPRWLRKVAERGLEVEPSRRHPDMGALIEALERGQARSRVRRAVAVLSLVGVAAAGAYGWRAAEHRAKVSACEAEGAQIGEVWNEDARSKLREALAGSGVPYGAETAEKVMPWLDDFAARWKGARTQACMAARVEAAWPAELYERAAWCLDEERMRLSSLVEVLGRGDAKAVEKAVPAVSRLPPPEGCVSHVRIVQISVPPAESREEVRGSLAELGRVRTLLETGAYDEGIDVARALLKRAAAFEWPPLTAEVRYTVGLFAGKKGDYEEAEVALEEAYFEAAKAGAEEVAFDAANAATAVVGNLRARIEDGMRWSRIAEVHLSRMADVAGVGEADWRRTLGDLERARGRFAEARRLTEQALRTYEAALGAGHPKIAEVLDRLALAHRSEGDLDEAQRIHERALAIRERALGPEHPDVASSLNNLAIVYWRRGDYASARRLYARALTILERALGPDHPRVAQAVNNLAILGAIEGDHDLALRMFERARAVKEATLGPDHPEVASVLNNLGALREARGEYDAAWDLHERALQIRERALGADHPDVAHSLNNLAVVAWRRGKYDDARRLHARAGEIWARTLGPDDPQLGYVEFGLARLGLSEGRPTEAITHAERALALWDRTGHASEWASEARFLLARALWAAGRDRARALDLARKARDAYRKAGKSNEKELAEVEAWLAEREASK